MNLQSGKFGSGPSFRVASLWSVAPVTVRLTRVKQHSPGRAYVKQSCSAHIQEEEERQERAMVPRFPSRHTNN